MTSVSGLKIIKKYNWQVPRYTSYPPAPRFTQSPDEARTMDLIFESEKAVIGWTQGNLRRKCVFRSDQEAKNGRTGRRAGIRRK